MASITNTLCTSLQKRMERRAILSSIQIHHKGWIQCMMPPGCLDQEGKPEDHSSRTIFESRPHEGQANGGMLVRAICSMLNQGAVEMVLRANKSGDKREEEEGTEKEEEERVRTDFETSLWHAIPLEMMTLMADEIAWMDNAIGAEEGDVLSKRAAKSEVEYVEFFVRWMRGQGPEPIMDVLGRDAEDVENKSEEE